MVEEETKPKRPQGPYQRLTRNLAKESGVQVIDPLEKKGKISICKKQKKT